MSATEPLVLQMHDTATKQLEPILPGPDGVVHIYACGPTVYRDAHVGNLRTFLLADLVARTLGILGTPSTAVMNITDVGHMVGDADAALVADTEDKLLAQARIEGRGALAVARAYEAGFHRDLERLGVRPAHHYPRASEWIEEMITLTERLVTAGFAYQGGDGSVYFDARSFPSYGTVSGNRLDELQAGHRADAATLAEGKRFHADWALWKTSDRTELTWDSPWGRGFPGWHLECSAMSLSLLDECLDLHLGGIDLRFPHHENERAQSEAAAGHAVITRWVHGEHLLFEGRKMAKSSGNVVLLQDVVDRGIDPLALRLSFLEMRYRQQANLTWVSINSAAALLERWRTLTAVVPGEVLPTAREEILAALTQDLDTPRVVQILRRLERDDAVSPVDRAATLLWADELLGLDLARGPQDVQEQALPAGADALLADREAARALRTPEGFAASDRIRDELVGLGVVVRDTPAGQEWEIL